MSTKPTRKRNPKGAGTLLRADLIAAATAALAETGDERALSIREVARRAGVSPPAVYLHFEDKPALVRAALEAQFAELVEHVGQALEGAGDPVAALRAGCRAYLRFARDHPGSYRMLFGAQQPADIGRGDLGSIPGRAAFGQLVAGIRACQDAGRTPAGVPERDATLVWVGLHGLASLHEARPDFPWPPAEELLDDLLHRIVGLPPNGTDAPAPR
ncbi:AcrR family transcriptional regulator [Lipingzhangella halophila]|uniref:AcrR family transcriptional regulator n=1 Tax=Lipingzhangella halophila TaxID=1783352 RepID=A0A7W7W1P3_9ACTN|nr:TetR/AcrR family transcriptional regulator [Lipingzhangella halophila]MBB4929969.1 AcrR family transcriptional regulator [Lipingzhangella halophila]